MNQIMKGLDALFEILTWKLPQQKRRMKNGYALEASVIKYIFRFDKLTVLFSLNE